MNDILIPASAYSWPAFEYDPEEEVAWENKTHAIYWAGSSTGSYIGADTSGWKRHHRQRLVALANNLRIDEETHDHRIDENRDADDDHASADDPPSTFRYLQRDEKTLTWHETIRRGVDVKSYNVHLTSLKQCEQAACDAQRAFFGAAIVEENAPRGEALRYSLALDVDGNGHSGRFYRLLASRSLPLKMTVFKEWHDERLQAWLHYVPVSLGMAEFPETVRYFVEEEEGREYARLLAEQGRAWFRRGLRKVDQALYLHRVFLELARLQDPRREAFEE